MRNTMVTLTAAVLAMLPIQEAVAHGGGLNRDGCHNETATGGYHCHRKKEDEVNWKLLGGLLAGGLLVWAVVESFDEEPTFAPEPLRITPYFNTGREAGAVAEYSFGAQQIGVRALTDTEDGSSSVNAFWRLQF